MRFALVVVLFVCCVNQQEDKVDNSGSCTHSQLTGYYSNSNCTGTFSSSQLKSYCHDTTDTATCKTYTSCNSGFYYNDVQLAAKGKACAANGYPLACAGGTYKVSNLSNCP